MFVKLPFAISFSVFIFYNPIRGISYNYEFRTYIYICYICLDVWSTFCVTFPSGMKGNCLLTPFILCDEFSSLPTTW